MDQLLTAMGIFIEHPLLAAVAGLVLVGLGRWSRRRTATGAGVLWLLYALYETGMQRRWLCGGECNIRLDLFLIYPVLLLSVAASAFSIVRGAGKPRRTT